MESANEAGRRAARGVLAFLDLEPAGVKLFEYPALSRFRLLRSIDQQLHAAGLPHAWDLAEGAVARVRSSRPVRGSI